MPFTRTKSKRTPLTESELLEYAVATLARKMRSVRDLKRLMRTRAEEGEPGERAVDHVIVRLKELKYLSDTRFAADYIHLRKENEKYGRRRVHEDLIQKGIHKDLIASALTKAYEDIDEAALAREYIARKRIKQPTGPNAKKETARVTGRLIRAGFSAPAIYKILREWNIDLDESDVDTPVEESEDET